jgi:hypothetical protein
MAFSNPRTWIDSELVTAALLNAHLKDQLNAIWVGTTAGDIDYYTAANAKARLPIGSNYQTLKSINNAPVWSGPIGCRVYRSTSQSVNHNTVTDVASFDIEAMDTNGFHTGTGNTVTIPAGLGGIYLVGAYGWWTGHATPGTLRQLSLNIGGSFIIRDTRVQDNAASPVHHTLSVVQNCTDGTVIKIEALQKSGDVLSLANPGLWMIRLV